MPSCKAEASDVEAFEKKWADGRTRTPEKSTATVRMVEAYEGMLAIGLPCIIRPSFTLGGTGGGIAYNRVTSFSTSLNPALMPHPPPEVLIEESVLGWKEYEMEVVRDTADNCIIICSIENIDPMGVHTGDSITVAPALTLTDKEYQIMRNASIAVLREIGIETGGSNVQFAVNPAGRPSGRHRNESARVTFVGTGVERPRASRLPRSRRSSLSVTRSTNLATTSRAAPCLLHSSRRLTMSSPRSRASPSRKFPGAACLTLGTAMKSVGEVMAIGRTFQESFQKALRGLETGLSRHE